MVFGFMGVQGSMARWHSIPIWGETWRIGIMVDSILNETLPNHISSLFVKDSDSLRDVIMSEVLRRREDQRVANFFLSWQYEEFSGFNI